MLQRIGLNIARSSQSRELEPNSQRSRKIRNDTDQVATKSPTLAPEVAYIALPEVNPQARAQLKALREQHCMQVKKVDEDVQRRKKFYCDLMVNLSVHEDVKAIIEDIKYRASFNPHALNEAYSLGFRLYIQASGVMAFIDSREYIDVSALSKMPPEKIFSPRNPFAPADFVNIEAAWPKIAARIEKIYQELQDVYSPQEKS